jgi:hypothetical protein
MVLSFCTNQKLSREKGNNLFLIGKIKNTLNKNQNTVQNNLIFKSYTLLKPQQLTYPKIQITFHIN